MHRLANFDVSSRFRTPIARWTVEALFGLGCAMAMIALRSLLDLWVPTSGPFALVFPPVLIATLFGHWRGGLVAFLVTFFWAWWFVLRPVESFAFEDPTDPPRVAINAVSVAIIAVLAEAFRRAVQGAVAARDAEIARRGLLMAELEHRTKNNFALVASLLQLQKRRNPNPAVGEALDLAIGRVHTFARAYANLADSQGEGSSVEMADYLEEIVCGVTEGAFHEDVRVSRDFASCELPRQIAVAIGLFVNEALTNCAKYAFPDGRAGRVAVRFSCDGNDWEVRVDDDGIGAAAGSDEGSTGMGHGLMQAFAAQAGGEYEAVAQDGGHCVRLAGRHA